MKQKRKERPSEVDRQNQSTAKGVKEHLDRHREIDSSEVAVEVSDGSVLLTGAVDNGAAKNVVGNIVSGEMNEVKEVRNELTARRDISEAPPEEKK